MLMTYVSLKQIFSGAAKVKLCNLYLFVLQMASTWWERLSVSVNKSTAHVDNSSCFSATQSTVLKGVNFGGVPTVLLIDFSLFVVSSAVSWELTA